MLQVTKLLAVVAVVITLMQTLALPANAEIIPPGEEILGPRFCPQIEVSAVPWCYDRPGYYAITPADSPMPITDRNFVPFFPEAIDSYFPREQVMIKNIGDVEIEVGFVCD